MKTALLLSIFLFAGSSFAGGVCSNPGGPTYTRLMGWSTTCAQAQQALWENGSVIFYSSSSVYDRYVSSRCSCASNETIRAAYVPTTDATYCHLGYTCVENQNGGSNH